MKISNILYRALIGAALSAAPVVPALAQGSFPGASPRKYVAFYNGTNTTGPYNLGVATGRSPKAFGRVGIVAPISSYSATYKDGGGKASPNPVLVDDRIYVYYEAFNSGATKKNIFLEIYSTDGGLIEKPIEPVIAETAVASNNAVLRPCVLYEPSDALAPFKMIFSRATTGVDATFLTAATSLDGVNWTILGDILTISSGWESTYLSTTGRLLKDGSTYRLFYSGHNGMYWQSGELNNSGTFGTSGWSKNPSNPLLSPRGGLHVPLTGTLAAGTKTVPVANSALFDVGAPIVVYNSTAGDYQLNRIAAIPNGTELTTLYTWQGRYGTAGSAHVSQIQSGSVEISEIWFEDGKWKAILTCHQFTNGQGLETTGYAETSSLSNPFTIQATEWPLALNVKLVTWDQISAENLHFIRVQ